MVKQTNRLEDFRKALQSKNGEIMHDLSSQVLADCNKYVRMTEDKNTYNSSYIKSDLRTGTLMWGTPYATRIYYTGTPNTLINPDASLMWCEVARTNHKDDWLKILKNSIDENCLENL